MTDIDVGADARVIAFIDEPNHGIDIIQEAQAKRLQFERDIYFLFVRVIANGSAGFEGPVPLRLGRNDLALPHIFSQHEQDIAGLPGAGQVDEFPGALDVKITNRRSEINQTQRTNRQ